MRAFLAIPILAPALDDFQRLRATLATDLEGVRWTPEATPHVTVHFFGEVEEAVAGRAVAAVGAALAEQHPLQLWLAGLGAFPSTARPQVLWLGVAGDTAALAALAVRCRDALAGAGHATEARGFRAHCTLGRPRHPWDDAMLQRWRAAVARQPATRPFIADRLILYESTQSPAGVRHQVRATVTLPGS